MRERENQEVAFAGDDDGEGVAVGGEGIFAEGEAVKNGDWCGLGYGDFFFSVDRDKRRDGEPDDVARFFFEGALQEDARAVGSPARDAQADAKTGELIGVREAADLENFAVDEVSRFGAVGGNDEAAFVAVERGEFFVGIIEDVEILQARRAAHGVVLLDGDGEIHPWEPGDVAKRAALVRGRKRSGG